MTRLQRLLRLAVARGDRLAELNLRARIASVPWRPEPDYPVWTVRITRRAA